MNILAFETSCDETSVALVRDGVLLSNVVVSQIDTHREYGGVVPEMATREHLQNIAPVIESVFRDSKTSPNEIEGVAATRGPGLPPALMIGFRAAQGFAFALDCPFVGLHHHEAHLYSPWMNGKKPADWDSILPSVSLIASGGHTLLVQVDAPLRHKVLGTTMDDAAGECFDKVAKLIGLPYPGGPQIDRLARSGNAFAYDFPRPMLGDLSDDFSFSGLKTSVRYFLEKNPKLRESESRIRDLCASVQAAIVEVLVAKTIRAARRLGRKCISASGGVIRNRGLRSALKSACAQHEMQLRLSPPELCTDNAGMVGLLAELYFKAGNFASVNDDDIRSRWPLDEIGTNPEASQTHL